MPNSGTPDTLARHRSDPFTGVQLDELASPRIVRRGLAYARAGRVESLAAGPRRLQARVQGTGNQPYLVDLEHDGEELLCSCTCPFDWEPFCKHAIAALAAHGMSAAAVAGDRVDRRRVETAEPDIRSHELEVRRRRGEHAGFAIRHVAGDRYFGTFEIEGSSGRQYTVEIRSLRDLVNSCTCPDQAVSMIGTCKHIEAVLSRLRQRAPRRFAQLADTGPSVAQLVADRRDTPRIRLLLPASPSPAVKKFAAEFFDGEGAFRGDPVADFARLVVRGQRLRSLVIHRDALELADLLASDRQRRQRRDEVHRAVLAHGLRIPGVRTELYPFQLEGAAFLAAGGRALLGDEMGLGKTVQAIAAERILAARGEVNRTLIICPASLKAQWAAEIHRFTGLEAKVIEGSPRRRRAGYREMHAYTIANYEQLMRDHDAPQLLAPDLLILDEAQRLRNWRTLTAAAIKRVETSHVFVLTGTPLQNRLDDLYSIMQVIDRRVLGPLWSFNEQFIVREEGRNRIAGYRNLDELRRRLAPVVLRRTKQEVKLQLPERIDARFEVAMTPGQRTYMAEGVQTAARYAKLAEKRPLSPQELRRLFSGMQMARLACNAAGLVDKESTGSPKLDEFARLLEDLLVDSDRKAVVFSEWELFGRMAAEQAQRLGLGYVRFHGGVPSARRHDLIARFRDDPKCRLFFSTDAGGVGLNLQFASIVINLELPWNPAVLEQRIGRVHRHGQTEPVQVFFLVAEDSFESGLEQTLTSKRALFDAALERDTTVTAVEAPGSCLWVFREAVGINDAAADGSAAPAVIETTEDPASSPSTDDQSAPTTAAGDQPSTTAAADEQSSVTRLAGQLGPRLRQVLALPSGKRVALVDRLDAVTREAAQREGFVAMACDVAAQMSALGEDSPLARATVLLARDEAGATERDSHRDQHVAVARRKLAAARVLQTTAAGAEALAQAHAAMLAITRALAGTIQEADLPSPRLLYEILVPRGDLSLAQAALIARAGELARAYADAPQPVPEALLAGVIQDAEDLLAAGDRA